MKKYINEKNKKHISKKDMNKKKNIFEDKQNKKDYKKMLKIAIKSKRLMLFSLIIIFQAPLSNMAFCLYREIGEYEKIDI